MRVSATVIEQQAWDRPFDRVDKVLADEAARRVIQIAPVRHHACESDQHHTQVGREQNRHRARHVPDEAFALSADSPRARDKKHRDAPGVEAMDAQDRLGHVSMLHCRHQQNPAAERLEPVPPSVDRQGRNHGPQGIDSHPGWLLSIELVPFPS